MLRRPRTSGTRRMAGHGGGPGDLPPDGSVIQTAVYSRQAQPVASGRNAIVLRECATAQDSEPEGPQPGAA